MGQGAEIVVAPDFSLESMEEFIRTYMTYMQTARETLHAPPCTEIEPMPLPVQPKAVEALCGMSLPSLLQAVQDPKVAAALEQLILQTMSSQVYED